MNKLLTDTGLGKETARGLKFVLSLPRVTVRVVPDMVGVADGRLIQNHGHPVLLHHGIHHLLGNAVEDLKVLVAVLARLTGKRGCVGYWRTQYFRVRHLGTRVG